MKALVITLDDLNKYHIHGPLNSHEASKLTREAHLVILLCDAGIAKREKEDYNRFLECVSNSKLRVRKELQVKTMEYVTGTIFSHLVSIQDVPETTIMFFDGRREVDEVKFTEEV